MSIYNTAVNKPISTLMVFLAIMVLGVASYIQLPVDQYPKMDPPYITVMATYPGANAADIEENVAKILEDQLNSVDDLKEMTSTSYDNLAVISLEFEWEVNLDEASNDVRDAVDKAMNNLPDDIDRPTIMRFNTSMMPILIYAVTAKESYPGIDKILDDKLITRLNRVDGVASVNIAGSPVRVVYVDLDPNKLDAYNLTLEQIGNKILTENQDISSGNVKMGDMDYTLRVEGEFDESDQIKNLVLGTQNNKTIYLHDVATVRDTLKDITLEQTINRGNGGVLMVTKQTDANAVAVANQAKKEIEKAMKELPSDIKFQIISDNSDFIVKSINNLQESLMYALIFVVLVVFLFLGRWRATFIIALTIPISLIVAFIYLFATGESLNVISLSSLSIAIGMEVDDAIVVVEAVQSKFDAGYKSPYLATKDAMGDVTMAIVSCTCVFMAVFIPVTFMGGTSGVFYTQFGITMATAVGISMISALTLCPALCAIMMRPSDGTKSAKSINGRVRAAYNASFNAVLGKYKRGVMFFIRHRWMVWTSLAVAVALLVYLMSTTKTGLVPQEDQGVIMVNVSISPGSTLEETTKVMDRLENILKDTPEIEHYARVAGYGLISGQGTSYGTIIIRLKDWSERKGKEHSSDAVVSRLNAQFQSLKEVQVFSFQPAMIPGYGMGNSLELNLQDMTGGDLATFYEAAIQFLGALNQRPEVAMAYTSYAINFPQISVEVDAAKCKHAGISPSAVLDAVGSYCGGAYISNYNQYGKVYRVMMQASPEYRLDEQALNNMFVRNGTEMAPVSQFVTLKQVLGPETANRFNLYSTITANVNPADGYSSGEVQKVIEEVAAQSLPAGYGYEYGGMAREEASSGGAQTVFIYAICIFLIYLILACLYESFLIPFAVIFSVPFGLMGSFLFAKILGLENNIYLQTGVIMLIGLLAKTAILITEYAIERRRKGMGIVESAYSAAQVRLRPILMTVLTMIFGMLPLMFSSGAGANGNSSLGTGVVGGMAVGTLALLFVVPVFYIIFEFLQEKIRKPMEEEPDVQVLLEKEKSEVERERK